MRAGVRIKYENRSSDPIITTYELDKNIYESALFFQGNYILNQKLVLDGDVRLSQYYVNKSITIEPRLNLNYSIYNFLKFKCGVGRFSQNMVTIFNENDTYNPVNIWLPSESWMAPATATHIILGLFYETLDLNISVETYLKNYNNLTHYNRERIHPEDPFFIQGKGRSAGVDFSAQWLHKNWQSWFSYSMGYAQKELPFQYPKPAMVKFFPRYDRRHNLNFTYEYTALKNLSISCRFAFGSGMPFSFMIGAYERWSGWYISQPSDYPSHSDNEKQFYFTAVKSDIDAFRFPVYHRLDISINYTLDWWFMKMSLYTQILNLYNQSNVLYYDVYGDPYYSLPFLPIVGLEITF